MKHIRFQKHHRAASSDHVCTCLVTALNRPLRDTGRHHGVVVHPDMLDAQVNGLIDDLLGYIWAVHDEDSIHTLRYVTERRIASVAVWGFCTRMNGEYLVTMITQFQVDCSCPTVFRTGETTHRDTLLGKKSSTRS